MDFQEFKTHVLARCGELGVTEYELYYQAAESVSCEAFQLCDGIDDHSEIINDEPVIAVVAASACVGNACKPVSDDLCPGVLC